jgi:glyoxylase-like metal-dependent hydrolase (beta-lactamase superfamily II)
MQRTCGIVDWIAPDLRCVLAPNPSPMTERGTNTWLLGRRTLVLIDPGPNDPAHLAAILGALEPGERIAAILVTHAHSDHSALAPHLSKDCGAPVHGYGTPDTGRRLRSRELADADHIGGGEGIDWAFQPDLQLRDGQLITGEWGEIEVLHTPGHFAGHLSFAWNDRLFCGDTVMGWASSLISPPDGDMADYMATLRKLAARRWICTHPGHGPVIGDTAGRIADLIRHRRGREAAILHAVQSGVETLAGITARVYHDTPAALKPAAARNALAHLIDLEDQNLIRAIPTTGPNARFTPILPAPP